MFKINSKPRFWWPVDVKVPDPVKAGQYMVSTFQAEFDLLKEDQHQALVDEIQKSPARISTNASDIAYMKRVLRGWREIVGEDDQPLAFTDETVDFLLQQSNVRSALFVAYLGASRGEPYKRGA